MKLSAVRLGHANNSSSTHSILLNTTWKSNEDSCDEFSFGWEWFHLRTRGEKARYLGALVYGTLRGEYMSSEHARIITKDLLGVEVSEDSTGIDHQSVILLPRAHGSKYLDNDFIREFSAYILDNDNITIAGGNDNEDPSFPRPDGERLFKDLPRDGSWRGLYSRKDGVWWTLYNKNTGAKLRLSFVDDAPAYTASRTPELVDLKLTNYCGFGCSFCLAPDTKVLLADSFGWVPIADLKEGDQVWSFDETAPGEGKNRKNRVGVVERVWKTRKEAVRITTDQGSVVASMDHPFLMANNMAGRWLKPKQLHIGHRMAFGEAPWEPSRKTKSYMRGYLAGCTDGDGTARYEPLEGATTKPEDSRRQVWWRIAVKDYEVLYRVQEYLKVLEVGEFEINDFDHGHEEYRDSCFMKKVELRAREKVTLIKSLMEESNPDDEYARGYIAGFFDAEGSFSDIIRFAQKKDQSKLKPLESFLTRFGFDHVRESSGCRLRGGKWAAIKLLGLADPAILRKRQGQLVGSNGNHVAGKIIKLEYLGEMDLIDIQTSTRTFYANGFATHNCYQDSTKEGEHVKMEDLYGLVWQLQEAQVFEVALGGGETTAHPKFAEILGLFASHGITPNFTSFNMDWAKDKEKAEAVKRNCGSFAISSLDKKTLEGIKKWNESVVNEGPKGTMQIPLGCYPAKKVREALDYAQKNYLPVTLLGFKHFGRGTKVSCEDYSWVVDYIFDDKRYWSKIGADTLFVEQFQKILLAKGVHEKLMVDREGLFSCYIDAVDKKIGPSSYTDKMTPLPTRRDSLFDQFPYR